MSAPNQFRLLGQRRFLPFFGAQALGAFNDNAYKNVLLLLVTFGGTVSTSMKPDLLNNLAGGIFILPYLLFSGLGLVTGNLTVLLSALFMLGMHSTFFAPAKYGLLPQILRPNELIGGNA